MAQSQFSLDGGSTWREYRGEVTLREEEFTFGLLPAKAVPFQTSRRAGVVLAASTDSAGNREDPPNAAAVPFETLTLEGVWHEGEDLAYEIIHRGDQVTALLVQHPNADRFPWRHPGEVFFHGTLAGRSFRGLAIVNGDPPCEYALFHTEQSFEVSPDFTSLSGEWVELELDAASCTVVGVLAVHPFTATRAQHELPPLQVASGPSGVVEQARSATVELLARLLAPALRGR